jgi:hypothetical protein
MAMSLLETSQLKPSRTVRVVQAVTMREGSWKTRIEGRVLSCMSEPTGSWYAHGKGDRLWLQRLRIQKVDGEIVDLILAENSIVTILPDENR